jgi:hypothetical protein
LGDFFEVGLESGESPFCLGEEFVTHPDHLEFRLGHRALEVG